MAKKEAEKETVTVKINEKLEKKNARFAKHNVKLEGRKLKDGSEMKAGGLAKGYAYHDPDSESNPKPIGAEPIEVVRTPFVNQRLKAGDIVEIREAKAAKEEKK